MLSVLSWVRQPREHPLRDPYTMKQQDKIKVLIAVLCLAVAGAVAYMQFGGSGKPKVDPNQQVGNTGKTVSEVQSMSQAEQEALAEDMGANLAGQAPTRKPTPRRR
jgi:hypothetical protein